MTGSRNPLGWTLSEKGMPILDGLNFLYRVRGDHPAHAETSRSGTPAT